MKDIVSLLKKNTNNFDTIARLGKKLKSSEVLLKCGFRIEKDISAKLS